MKFLLRRLRIWLSKPFRRNRYYGVSGGGGSTEMNLLTGEGKNTDDETGEVVHFNAGPNPLGFPGWLIEILEDKPKTDRTT